MGGSISRLFEPLWGKKQLQVLMVGEQEAGKATILRKLPVGEVTIIRPTIGFEVKQAQYKQWSFTMHHLGGSAKMKPIWRHTYTNKDALIFVIDSTVSDRNRLRWTRDDFRYIAEDPLMSSAAILVLANKQDVKGCLTPAQVSEALGLSELQHSRWHVQGTVATKREGLHEGLAWLESTLQAAQSADQ